MKKLLRTGIILLTLLLIFVLSIPLVNNYSARSLQNRLTALPLPPSTEYIESLSSAGKLTGNGNGMQFFAALLIQSDLSAAELNTFYSTYRQNDWDCLVLPQSGRDVPLIEHADLAFTHDLSPQESYYIVYSWGDGIAPFACLDLRGH